MTQARMDPRTRRRSRAARRVRDLLRAAILLEEFSAGPLPGEAELMLSFSTSRQVVRDALTLLRDEGLVKRIPGTGTLSVASKVRHSFSYIHGPEPVRDTETVSHRILSTTREIAAPRVAERLRLPKGSACGVIEYLTFVGEEPYNACTAYVPPALLDVVARGQQVEEWYSVYELAGYELGVTDQAVEAILADDLVAELLNVAAGAPLLLFERLVRDNTGAPLEYAFARVRGDRMTLTVQLPRHSVRPRGSKRGPEA